MAMLTPERLLRLVIEIIFILLGLLVVWLGLTGHIFFNRHKLSWLILSVALILWGLRGIYTNPGRKPPQPEDYTRAISLTLLGIVLLGISRVPFTWVGALLACAGLLLTARGIVGSVLLWRPANVKR
jgi:sulfite exporter TauE/SafE